MATFVTRRERRPKGMMEPMKPHYRYLQVSVRNMPRETLKELLVRAQRGRGTSPFLTKEVKGFYYVRLDHDGVVATVKGNLRLMGGVVFNEIAESQLPGSTFCRAPSEPPTRQKSGVEAFLDMFDVVFGPRRPGRR